MIPIVFNVNKKYIPYLAVTIASILKNSTKKTQFEFYVLSRADLAEELDQLAFIGYDNFKIINVIVDGKVFDQIKNYQLAGHITFDGYLHAFIPKLLTNLDKCIHLDSDLLVLTDISRLYDIELEDYYMGGVLDFYPQYRRYVSSHFFTIIDKYGIDNEMYFNIGVKLLNLKKIRDDSAEDIFLNEVENYIGNKELTIFDQDLLNIVYQRNGLNKIKPIDPRWNAHMSAQYRPSRDCFIMHWPGGHKPWVYPLAPHVKLYMEYARMTQFYDQIRLDLLNAVNQELEYLETKLYFKRYKLRLALFDFKFFGKPVFPKKVAHYKSKVDKYLKQKNDKKFFYDKLKNLQLFLSK